MNQSKTAKQNDILQPQSSFSDYRIEEKWCGEKDSGIYGQLFIPERADRGDQVPLVIFCHELYRNHESGLPYCMELAKRGYAAYAFDCRGASKESRSPGSMLNMSVRTCARDLMEVYEEALNWPFADRKNIFVIGASQGAFSTAIAAAQYPDAFAGIVLMYGAFVIMDDVREMFADKESVPDSFDYKGWSTMGACYLTDLWDFDLREFQKYRGPVLVLHGDEDPLVDPSYSRKVAKIYTDADFYLIKGGRHGFRKEAFSLAFDKIYPFLVKNTDFLDAAL